MLTERLKCAIVRLAESNGSLMAYVQSRRGCLRTRPLAIDYLPALRAIAKAEDIRKATSRKRRYDDSKSVLFSFLIPSYRGRFVAVHTYSSCSLHYCAVPLQNVEFGNEVKFGFFTKQKQHDAPAVFKFSSTVQ